jgi:hypothetical protein
MGATIESQLKKVLHCTECLLAIAFLAVLVPLLLISVWLFVTGQ